MTAKIDTSPEALRVLAQRIQEVADYLEANTGVVANNIECAILTLRALADEKANLVRERDEARAKLDALEVRCGGWIENSAQLKTRAEKAEADAVAMQEALRNLVNQITKCNPTDDHGHDFKMNRAYHEGMKVLDVSTAGIDLLAWIERMRSGLQSMKLYLEVELKQCPDWQRGCYLPYLSMVETALAYQPGEKP